MKCTNCGAEIPDGYSHCIFCGFKSPKAPPAAPQYNSQPAVWQYNPQSSAWQYNPQRGKAPENAAYAPQNQSFFGPSRKFATSRGLAKMFFLSLLTLGIYQMVVWSRMADELNMAASRYDGRKTMPFVAMLFVSPCTLTILTLVWNHRFAKRLGSEARRRGYDTSFGASDYWLWNILGSLILIGPFVYIHRLCKTMNRVNESYNYYG